MSRIGKKPISIPDGVKVSVSGPTVKAEGPKGAMACTVPANIKVTVDAGKKQLRLECNYQLAQDRMNHGLHRSIVNNMVTGVSKGYEKKLEINGTGYNAKAQGKELIINIGLSHPVKINVPDGIKIEIPNPNNVVVQGVDRELVGQFAAKVRFIRPAEPYNLKGIKYADEVIRRKAGKTFVTGTA